MTVLIIDGQGGNIGKQLAARLREEFPSLTLHGVGTNSIATSNMLKGGVDTAATGENAVSVACRGADIIVGPVGIVIADSLMGEVTPAMARDVGQSPAVKILVPMNRCDTLVAGIGGSTVSELITDAVEKVGQVIAKRSRT